MATAKVPVVEEHPRYPNFEDDEVSDQGVGDGGAQPVASSMLPLRRPSLQFTKWQEEIGNIDIYALLSDYKTLMKYLMMLDEVLEELSIPDDKKTHAKEVAWVRAKLALLKEMKQCNDMHVQRFGPMANMRHEAASIDTASMVKGPRAADNDRESAISSSLHTQVTTLPAITFQGPQGH